MEQGGLKCRKCGEYKTESKFTFNPKTYRHGTICADCRYSATRQPQIKKAYEALAAVIVCGIEHEGRLPEA